jgi:hypothetical protein
MKKEGRMMDERRIFHRLSMHGPVIIDDKEKGEMKNISVGGVCVIALQSIHEACNVYLEFTMPGGEKIKVQGITAWCQKKPDNKSECGLEFENLRIKDYEIIRGYIQKGESG